MDACVEAAEPRDIPPRITRVSAFDRFSTSDADAPATGAGAAAATIPEDQDPAQGMEEWLCNLPPALLEGCKESQGCKLASSACRHLRWAADFIAAHGLTNDEALACCVWTMEAPKLYGRMSALMRQGDEAGLAPYRTWIHWLLRGARKLPDYDGIVYRAHKDKSDAATFVKGSEVSYRSFTACAGYPTKQQLERFGRDRGILMVLGVRGAKRVGPLSVFPDEQEVLLLPGWRGIVGGSVRDRERQLLSEHLQLKLTPFTVVEVHQVGLGEDQPRLMSVYEQLLRASEEELRVQPDSATVHYAHGVILQESNRFEDAKAQFARAVALDPANQTAHVLYGTLLAEHLHLNTEAKAHFETAVNLDPNSALAHYRYGRALARCFGDAAAAVVHLDAAVRLEPTAEYHAEYACILHVDLGMYAKAREQYAAAVRLGPADAVYHAAYAALLEHHLGLFPEAKEQYEASLRQDNESATTHAAFASLLETHFNDYAGAQAHYTASLHVDPNIATVHAAYAHLAMKHLSRHDIAKDHMAAAVGLEPDKAAYHVTYAFLAGIQFGLFSEAEDHLSTAARLDPAQLEGGVRKWMEDIRGAYDRLHPAAAAPALSEPFPSPDAVRSMGVKDLKAVIRAHSIDVTGCIEKHELVAAIERHRSAATTS